MSSWLLRTEIEPGNQKSLWAPLDEQKEIWAKLRIDRDMTIEEAKELNKFYSKTDKYNTDTYDYLNSYFGYCSDDIRHDIFKYKLQNKWVDLIKLVVEKPNLSIFLSEENRYYIYTLDLVGMMIQMTFRGESITKYIEECKNEILQKQT